MQLIDPHHPVYRALWVRVLIVAVCLGWATFEALKGDPLWAVLFGAAGIYSLYVLLIAFKPKPVEPAMSEPAED